MALIYNGIKISLGVSQIPSGFTTPDVTEFTDQEYIRNLTVSIPRDGIVGNNGAETLSNIISNVVGLESAVSTLLEEEHDTAALDVTYYIDFKRITSNIASNTSVGGVYTDTTVNYIADVDIYVKTATV